MTVISITHDLDEVTLSDRVLVMKNGQIESSSSPRELFSRGDELLDLGLDIPFTSTIIKALRQIGFTFDNRYLLEKELEDKLWALISKVSYTYQAGTPFEGRALFNVSLEIKDGSFTAFIGHTGSGKINNYAIVKWTEYTN